MLSLFPYLHCSSQPSAMPRVNLFVSASPKDFQEHGRQGHDCWPVPPQHQPTMSRKGYKAYKKPSTGRFPAQGTWMYAAKRNGSRQLPFFKNSRRSCLPANMRTAIYMPDTARGRKIRWHQVNSTIPAASPRALTPLCEPVPGFFPLPAGQTEQVPEKHKDHLCHHKKGPSIPKHRLQWAPEQHPEHRHSQDQPALPPL